MDTFQLGKYYVYGKKMQIELTPTAGNEAFYAKAGFKYRPDKITGMYLWIKK